MVEDIISKNELNENELLKIIEVYRNGKMFSELKPSYTGTGASLLAERISAESSYSMYVTTKKMKEVLENFDIKSTQQADKMEKLNKEMLEHTKQMNGLTKLIFYLTIINIIIAIISIIISASSLF